MPHVFRFLRRPLVAICLAATALAAWAAADWYVAAPKGALAAATYVGRASCIECHQAEAEAWQGSDHDLAMDRATEATVLGDFNDAEFQRFEERTRFFRDGERFMVNAEGPDGQYHDYEVKYTFGVRPLQQYMVEFPDGRVQVLRVSWDVDKKEWFYVAPPDAPQLRIEAGDPLHWTGLAQNWNTMCAECHSTDYHKNFNLEKNTYHSTFNEIDVSCEACHGPGSLHVDLATRRSLFWDRNVKYGLTNSLKNAVNTRQVETCAPCHSRRAIIHPDYRPGDSYFDHFEPALLHAGLYHADGQILDEVYEFGSFTQSKMYRKGVKCTDCHDPHSLHVKFEGNRLCAQCHQPGKYDGAGHHHHTNAAAGAPETQCVTCHMPTTTYMGIDERLDHSIRVPRPDLTVKLGTPNVCNRCHTKPEENAQWAADAVVKWYGDKRPDDPHPAEAIDAAQRGKPEGGQLLSRLLRRDDTPAVVRATAAALLAAYPEAIRAGHDALHDESPWVRAAAVRSVLATSASDLIRLVTPLFKDALRNVRMAAAHRLVDSAGELANSEFRKSLEDAAKEYREGQGANLDRAQSHRNLAGLDVALEDPAAAVRELRTAIRLEPYLTEPRTELSQLLAEIMADPTKAKLRQELGVTDDEIRKLREEEVDLLARDAELLPGNGLTRHHRGRLLYLLGREDEAREEFAKSCELTPDSYEFWMWLALICERQKRWEEAVQAVQRMAKLRPDAPEWQGMLQRMKETVDRENAAAAAKAEEAGAETPPEESTPSPSE